MSVSPQRQLGWVAVARTRGAYGSFRPMTLRSAVRDQIRPGRARHIAENVPPTGSRYAWLFGALMGRPGATLGTIFPSLTTGVPFTSTCTIPSGGSAGSL